MSTHISRLLGTALCCAALGLTVAPASAQPGLTLTHLNGLAAQSSRLTEKLNIGGDTIEDRAAIGLDVSDGMQRSELAA